MEQLILTNEATIERILRRVIDESDIRQLPSPISINAATKITKRSPRTIKKMIKEGHISTTVDGKIPHSEIKKLIKAI